MVLRIKEAVNNLVGLFEIQKKLYSNRTIKTTYWEHHKIDARLRLIACGFSIPKSRDTRERKFNRKMLQSFTNQWVIRNCLDFTSSLNRISDFFIVRKQNIVESSKCKNKSDYKRKRAALHEAKSFTLHFENSRGWQGAYNCQAPRMKCPKSELESSSPKAQKIINNADPFILVFHIFHQESCR